MGDLTSKLHFIRPEMFWLILPALLMSYLLFHAARQQSWNHLIATELLQHLAIGKQTNRKLFFPLFTLFVWLISIVALAGPSWEKTNLPVSRSESSVVIVLDLSLSMLAEDNKPSRLTRAKHKITDILEERKQGSTGLVVYSGDAHRVVPLSEDNNNIIALLQGLSPEMMPVIGSRPELALQQAKQLIRDAYLGKGDILWLTDDIEDDQITLISEILEDHQGKVGIIAFGTEQGAPIPMPDGSHFRNAYGETVIAKTPLHNIRNAANAIDAEFHRLSIDNRDYRWLLDTNYSNQQLSETDRDIELWVDAGIYLVYLLLPVCLLFFRRGTVFAFTLFAMLQFHAEPLQAQQTQQRQQLQTNNELKTGNNSAAGNDSAANNRTTKTVSYQDSFWNRLWYNKDQRGQKALNQGDAEAASQLFENQQWQATAQFRKQDFATAADIFSADESATGQYNQATSLAKAGKFEEALLAYEKLLEQHPSHQDALANKQIIEDILEQQQQQESKQQDNQQQQDKQQQNNQQDSEQNNSEQQDNNQQQESQHQQEDSNQNPQQNQDKSDQQSASGQDGNAHSENPTEGEQDSSATEEQDEQNSESEQNQQGQQQETQNQQHNQQNADNSEQNTMAEQQQQQENQLPSHGAAKQLSPEELKQQQEQQRKVDAWLEQIPDDPSGLLRRKFLYESRLKQGSRHNRQESKLW